MGCIRGRWTQQIGQTIYAVDKEESLYRIEWQDIKDGKYIRTLAKSNVKSFYVDRSLGLATVNLNGTLSLASRNEVDLRQKVDPKAK